MKTIRVQMHDGCLVTHTHVTRAVSVIQNRTHEFNGWRIAHDLPVPTGDRAAVLIGNGISAPTNDARGCFGVVRAVCQYAPDDGMAYLIVRPHDGYAVGLLYRNAPPTGTGYSQPPTPPYPAGAVAEHVGAQFVAGGVRIGDVPAELHGDAAATAVWLLSTFCPAWDKAAVVGRMHV